MISLTIGTFDGVHLGHQHLFKEMKKYGTPIVYTFSNHPAEILRPNEVPSPILTLEEKLELFKQFGIEKVIVVPFTKELSQVPYDQFLNDLRTEVPYTTLVAGEDIRIGARGEGNRHTLQNLVTLPKFTIDGEVVSSRLIRSLIKNHQYDQARKLLGHTKGSLWLDSPVVS